MKNQRIGVKLAICFAALFVGLLGLGIVAIVQLSTMGSLADDIGNDRRTKVEAATQISAALLNYRASEATHILSTDQAEMQRIYKEMEAERAAFDKQVKWLDPKVKKPATRAALDRLTSSWAEFQRASEKTLEYSFAVQNQQAYTSFLAERPIFMKARDAAVAFQLAEEDLMISGAKKAMETYYFSRMVIIGTIIAVALLVVGMLYFLIQHIVTPLGAMTRSLGELANGNMNAAIPVDDRGDEIGDMATAMTGLRNQLAAAEKAKQDQARLIVDSIGTGLGLLAQGDLTAQVDADLTGPFARLKDDFNNAVSELRETMQSVADAVSSINSGATEIRAASDDLAARTEHQAASLEETAAAMGQATVMVKQTAAGAEEVGASISSAEREAGEGVVVVDKAVGAMTAIEQSSHEITQIINVIDGIAFQTNLLALNAGVEAARAGDAGKGFAVVATEVRALAQRSADAAKDIKALITKSTEQVSSGVALVGETGTVLKRIMQAVGEVNKLIADISASAQTQSANIQQVNGAVGDMDKMTQQNAAMVEESTAAAQSLASEADALSAIVARFNTGQPMVEQPRARSGPAKGARGGARRRARPALVQGNLAVKATDDDADWAEF